MLNGKRRVLKPLLESLLAAWKLPDEHRVEVLETWLRIAEEADRNSNRLSRFDEASPRELGIHAAIRTPQTGDELPSYVERDFDSTLEQSIGVGATRGCFIILVGGSSTGKTRSLYECVLNAAPSWWLIQPSCTDEILDLLHEPSEKAILWLDELHRFLGATPPLTRDVMRTLTKAGMVVVGTLWSDEYTARKSLRRTDSSDKHAHDRTLLEFAEVISVPPTLVGEECGRAELIAETDIRIRLALASSDAGLTQVLAAGPDLVHRWEQAPPYAHAVITVAADARRLGVHSPLPAAVLQVAMAGYLRPAERVMTPTSWLDAAIPYAETPLHGTVAALFPVAGREPGTIAGYLVADYLAQHLRQARRSQCPPDSLWQALIDGVDNLDDLRRLQHSATARMRYRYAERALRRLAELRDTSATMELATLLVRQDRLAEAHSVLAELARHLPNDQAVAERLAQVDELGVRACADPPERRAEFLHDEGRTADLRTRAAAGSSVAADDLAFLLADRGCLGELRIWADAGNRMASDLLAELLATHRRLPELRRRADSGDAAATRRLAKIDVEPEDPADERGITAQISTLRAAVDAGERDAADSLATLLFESRRERELRAEVDAGTPHAGERLIALLTAEQSDVTTSPDVVRLRAFGLLADGTPVVISEPR